MLGFAVLISKNKEISENSFTWKSTFDFQVEHVLRKKDFSNVCIEQNTAKRFLNEKLWVDTDDYFVVTEGVITNLKILYKKYLVENYENLIAKICTRTDFFMEFIGNFAGYIFLKKENKHILFNNHSASKKVFYFSNENYCVFSTDLFTLSKKLNDLKIAKSLNIEAAYLLLTSGFMHENMTLINEVKQLRAGEYLCIDSNKDIKTDFYFHLNDIVETQDKKADIIEKLDEKFRNAVNLEFNQDIENHFTSLSTLSGGLDSRMTTLIAHKNQFTDVQCICFTEKNYADEIIAKKIAKSYNLSLQTYHLSANGLTAIEDVVKINDGLCLYSGAGHAFEALRNYKLQNIGFLHTGLIGDGVFGSYIFSEKEKNIPLSVGLYSMGLFEKAKPIIEKYISNYKNDEIYLMYNRAFLGINNGFLFFDLAGESASPFLVPDFMHYAFSIPREMRYKKRIYIDWVREKHPDIAGFTWENIGGKPTNNKLLKQYYHYKRAAIKRIPLINSMWKKSMNPEQLWYNQTPEVKKYLDNYFGENIFRAEKYIELKTDLITLYKNGNIIEKTQVLTLLAALKLLFE
ncbi:MAG: asparagine synthase-related protein [Candidatus Azobacteroides sp.]|nr:asparagine synthase-related protein [Candidatus Azobacteroides sp.]